MSLLLLFNKWLKLVPLYKSGTGTVEYLDFDQISVEFLQNSDPILDITVLPNQNDFVFEQQETIIRPTILPILDNISCLRYDDVSLSYFIQEKLKEKKLNHVYVFDGFKENEDLIIPSIVIEHVLSFQKGLELGNFNRNIRDFEIEIYGRTKGERDDLSQIIEDLLHDMVETDDERFFTISRVECIESEIPSTKLATIEKKYWNVFFNGQNTYIKIINEDNMTNLTELTMEFDIKILDQDFTSGKFIFDKYDHELRRGIESFIDDDYNLFFVIGNSTDQIYISTNIQNHLNKRIQLTFKLKIEFSKVTLEIYIDKNLAKSQIFSYILDDISAERDLYLGCSFSDFGYSQFLSMNLYCFKLSSLYNSGINKIGEYLNKTTNDLVYFEINEGHDNLLYDNGLDDIAHDSNIFGDFEWNNYLTTKTKGSIYRSSRYNIRTIADNIC